MDVVQAWRHVRSSWRCADASQPAAARSGLMAAWKQGQPPRRRGRVRLEPGRGRVHDQVPGGVRGRAADGAGRGRGGGAHRGREAQRVTEESDLERVRELAAAALANLEQNRRRIDDLNVYPVPDGDTGTNLTLTVRSIVESLEAAAPSDRPTVARAVARAALMGARGNSGVIFSQIVRGAADVLGEAPSIDATVLAAALRSASDAASRAVRQPVEGTMLTVIRELAEEAEAQASEEPNVTELLADVVRRGEDAVRRAPEQLAVLREAGGVHPGGGGALQVRGGAPARGGGGAPPGGPPPGGVR